MKIEYKITKYFESNNLFDDTISDGLKIIQEEDNLLISGSSVDLVNLADILVNVAMEKEKEAAHIHIDDLTLLDKDSDYKEIIIEKITN